jgi:hypothetical protein
MLLHTRDEEHNIKKFPSNPFHAAVDATPDDLHEFPTKRNAKHKAPKSPGKP